MKSPRDLDDLSSDLRDLRKLKDDGGSMRDTDTLPLNAARLKARQIPNEYPTGGYVTILENWRKLPDGQIEFTMRRLPAAARQVRQARISQSSDATASFSACVGPDLNRFVGTSLVRAALIITVASFRRWNLSPTGASLRS